MNNSIREGMQKRNLIHKKAFTTYNSRHWEKYRDLRNTVIVSRDKHNKTLSDQINKSYPLINGGEFLNTCQNKMITINQLRK